MIGGRKVKARYCTKCLRIIRTAHPRIDKGSVQVTIEESSPKAVVKTKETHPLSDDILKAVDKKVAEKEAKEELAEEIVPASWNEQEASKETWFSNRWLVQS